MRVVAGQGIQPGEQRGGDFEDAGEHGSGLLEWVGATGRWTARARDRSRTGRTGGSGSGGGAVSQRPATGAVHLDRLAAVLGTGGEEPARRRPAGERPLVPADRAGASGAWARPCSTGSMVRDRWRGRGRRRGSPSSSAAELRPQLLERQFGRRRLRARAAASRPAAPGSHPPRGSSARSRRRSRLRVTAGPRARPSANATDVVVEEESGHQLHQRAGRRIRLPSRARRSNACTPADPLDQADSRARPLARRFLSTARPARVLMRARNPCFFARRWALGWNVRFTTSSYGRPACRADAGCHDLCQDADAPRRCTGANRRTCDLARLRPNRHARQPGRTGASLMGPAATL